jgi:hypothetical protein
MANEDEGGKLDQATQLKVEALKREALEAVKSDDVDAVERAYDGISVRAPEGAESFLEEIVLDAVYGGRVQVFEWGVAFLKDDHQYFGLPLLLHVSSQNEGITPQIYKKIVEHHAGDVNERHGATKLTFLHMMMHADPEFSKVLIEAGADPMIEDAHSMSAYEQVKNAYNGVKLLHERKKDQGGAHAEVREKMLISHKRLLDIYEEGMASKGIATLPSEPQFDSPEDYLPPIEIESEGEE